MLGGTRSIYFFMPIITGIQSAESRTLCGWIRVVAGCGCWPWRLVTARTAAHWYSRRLAVADNSGLTERRWRTPGAVRAEKTGEACPTGTETQGQRHPAYLLTEVGRQDGRRLRVLVSGYESRVH